MMTRVEAEAFALTFVGTPYVRAGRIRGVGVDCGTILAEYLLGIGACTEAEMDVIVHDLGFLSNDWFCHATSEKYQQALRSFAPLKWEGVCRGTPPGLPGDIAMYRVVNSDLYNHGSILLTAPNAIHAVAPKVAKMRPTLHPMTCFRQMAIFDPWGAR